jgi:hypothetical protein
MEICVSQWGYIKEDNIQDGAEARAWGIGPTPPLPIRQVWRSAVASKCGPHTVHFHTNAHLEGLLLSRFVVFYAVLGTWQVSTYPQ